MPKKLAGARGLLLLGLTCLLALGAGCATMDTMGKELEKGYHAVAQEEYFVKRPSRLWARPDRSSAERGHALKGDKVVKLSGDVRGWSKVRVEPNGVEGWLPAALLSKSPVRKNAPRAKPAAKAAPAEASPPAAKPESGSLLSPPSAEAAEKPPATKEAPPKRKADPKKFEAL